MENIMQIVDSRGFPYLISIMAIGFILYYVKNLKPILSRIEENQIKSETREIILTKAIDSNSKAFQELAKSNDNVAHSLELINSTNQGTAELIRVLLDDTKETQARLYTHDDRSEKILTILKRLEDKLINNKKTEDKYGN